MNERSTRKTIILIKITNNTFKRFILIYSNHNPKDEFHIKTSYLIFIFKTDDIKRGL